ncbi:MAG: hypothetical protein WAU02_02110 [Candidatus Saccharimonadales bacterium]
MSDDQFTKIMQEFIRLDNKITSARDELKSEMQQGFDRVNMVLDQQSILLDRDEAERLSLSKQVDRHDEWIERAAKHTGVRFVRTS